MKRNIRAVIIEEGSVVLIRRVRERREYWVFPGGSVEGEESDVEALVREILEELGMMIEPLQHWGSFDALGNSQLFYLCRRISGCFEDAGGPEYNSEEYAQRGTYDPKFVPISLVSSLNLVPEDARRKLVEDSTAGLLPTS